MYFINKQKTLTSCLLYCYMLNSVYILLLNKRNGETFFLIPVFFITQLYYQSKAGVCPMDPVTMVYVCYYFVNLELGVGIVDSVSLWHLFCTLY